MTRMLRLSALVLAFVLTTSLAGQDMRDVSIKSIRITDSVYMLTGRGGNIGLSVGEDGVFLIDDQFAPLTDKILAAVAELTDDPIQFVVNTHWHPDHTGGNENLGEAGAIIVAHENVRKRMSTEQFIAAFNNRSPPSPAEALPVITFTDSITFHYNGDELRVAHMEPAHTDGDSVIFFRKANVVHMGDTYFNGMYPFIDVGSGGSIDGMVKAARRVLGQVNDRTKIIPGHGALSDVRGLRAFVEMLETVRGRVQKLVDKGNSREDVVAARPTRDFDAQWGGGFLEPDKWVGIVYDGTVK